jgi:hypothetical protein
MRIIDLLASFQQGGAKLRTFVQRAMHHLRLSEV